MPLDPPGHWNLNLIAYMLLFCIGLIRGQDVSQSPAESLPHVPTLKCFDCNSIRDGESCYSITENATHLDHQHKRTCSPMDTFCKVRRVEYKVEYNPDLNPWSMERGCSANCSDFCVTMGTRTRITYCTSCCTSDFCNVGNGAQSCLSLTQDLLLLAFSLLYSLAAGSWPVSSTPTS